ncbi:hypothetical protein BH09PSE6_BH09PSE6_30320 [soil metagenome]
MSSLTKRAGASVKAAAAALFAVASFGVQALEKNQVDFTEPMSPIAAEIYTLHHYVMGVCLAIFVVVFGWMAYSIYKHRKSNNPNPAQFHENTAVEIVWTIVPFIIVVALAIPATKTVVAMKDTSNAALTIKATGYQWKWGYDYLNGEGEGISFLSNLSTPRSQIDDKSTNGAGKAARDANEFYLREVDEPLVVPVDTKVRVITTANDVIHAFFVPALGIKQDAIPGFVRDTWFRATKVGTFRGQCAELCGKDHAFMPIVVEVKSKADYASWVTDKRKARGLEAPVDASAPAAPAAVAGTPTPVQVAAAAPAAAVAGAPAAGAAPAAAAGADKTYELAELKTLGEKAYGANCVACHQANGKGVPPTFPALDGSKIVQGPAEAHIGTVLHGIQKNGVPTAMASFARLSDLDIAAILTYERNSWGNNTGKAVQPKDVAALRGK